MEDFKKFSIISEDVASEMEVSPNPERDEQDKTSFIDDCDSLEYEDIYPFQCSTNTPTLIEAFENEETDGSPFCVIGEKVYNEFQWSDSEESEIDLELSNKTFEVNEKKTHCNKQTNADQPPSLVSPDEPELQDMTEEEKINKRQIWLQELAKIEEEIQTLKHVLQSKQRDSQELKKKLRITVWKELTDDLSQGVKNVKESNIYQKTESVVKATAESTKSIIEGLTGGFTQKIGQLKNSESFKSLEEKVGSAYENVKTKVSSSQSSSVQSFNEALCEGTANKNVNPKSPTSPAIPEDKLLS